jgi:hypothetical protein
MIREIMKTVPPNVIVYRRISDKSYIKITMCFVPDRKKLVITREETFNLVWKHHNTQDDFERKVRVDGFTIMKEGDDNQLC